MKYKVIPPFSNIICQYIISKYLQKYCAILHDYVLLVVVHRDYISHGKSRVVQEFVTF